MVVWCSGCPGPSCKRVLTRWNGLRAVYQLALQAEIHSPLCLQLAFRCAHPCYTNAKKKKKALCCVRVDKATQTALPVPIQPDTVGTGPVGVLRKERHKKIKTIFTNKTSWPQTSSQTATTSKYTDLKQNKGRRLPSRMIPFGTDECRRGYFSHQLQLPE